MNPTCNFKKALLFHLDELYTAALDTPCLNCQAGMHINNCGFKKILEEFLVVLMDYYDMEDEGVIGDDPLSDVEESSKSGKE